MMSSMELSVAESETNPGEAATRRRIRYRNRVMIGSMAIGLVLGFSLSFFDVGDGDLFSGTADRIELAPAIAVLLAIGFGFGLVALPLYMYGKVDELAQRDNMIGMSAGWFAVIGGYPIWQSLAAGGLAGQPTAFGIFALGFLFTMVTFGILKLRAR